MCLPRRGRGHSRAARSGEAEHRIACKYIGRKTVTSKSHGGGRGRAKRGSSAAGRGRLGELNRHFGRTAAAWRLGRPIVPVVPNNSRRTVVRADLNTGDTGATRAGGVKLGEANMMRRWVGAAVIAGCLGLAPAARRNTAPARPPRGRCPSRSPFVPNRGLIWSRPAQHRDRAAGTVQRSSAFPTMEPARFSCKCNEPEEACYFSVGVEILQRQNLASDGVIAVLDPSASKLDTGIPPPANSKPIQELSDLNPHYNGGPRATLGYLFNGNQAVEVSGFYIFQNSSTAAVLDPGRVDFPSALRRSASRATTACGSRPIARLPRCPRPCGAWKPTTVTPTPPSPERS